MIHPSSLPTYIYIISYRRISFIAHGPEVIQGRGNDTAAADSCVFHPDRAEIIIIISSEISQMFFHLQIAANSNNYDVGR